MSQSPSVFLELARKGEVGHDKGSNPGSSGPRVSGAWDTDNPAKIPIVRSDEQEGEKHTTDFEWRIQASVARRLPLHGPWVEVKIHRLLISVWNRKFLNSFAARQSAG